ncbi:phage gp46-like protein [Paucimonas lemoignei]|uniref:Phage gp46-like protein n=1 Tax=Paucimonas lemoignei TaxID=29443 RepID=A0A4R3I0H5_PAULE|nr:phage GP46 family protein [Paucimonas lemoignei]TCS38473.1 phage gp46-like protein [Paucimonas lemoignei]
MDRQINPLTGDYSGKIVRDLSNAIYLRITVPLGSYWADKTLGSKLYKLRRAKDVERNKRLAIQWAKEALQPLIDDKRADSIEVDAQWAHDGRLQLVCQVYQGEQVTAFSHYVKVA